MNVSSFTCQVCNKNKSNYTCPRCNAMYCTLACYKKHDEQCTNQFYSAHVMDSIRNEKSTKEESIAMAKTLKKLYTQQMEEDEQRDKIIYQQKRDDELLTQNLDKLQQLALNDTIDITDLTQYQQQQFAHAIQNGQLHHHIHMWNPWWNTSKSNGNNIIISETDVLDENDPKDEHKANNNISLIIPPLPIDIPSFDSIHAKDPSPLLPFLLCDILCAYVGAMITYNGDWNDEPSNVLQLILSISCVLSDKQCVHKDFNALTNTLMEHYASQSVKNNKYEILLYLQQVCVLMKNTMNVLRALNQIYELIQVIQSQIMSKAKVAKTLNKKMKKLEIETDTKKQTNKPKEGDYYDDHADAFMNQMMNVDKEQVNAKETTKKVYHYSSSFAPEKVRKRTRKKCKQLDPIKRKIWYYLVWFNQYVARDKANLLSEELKMVVEHINAKCSKIDNDIKSSIKLVQ
eukprot:192159_1